MYLKRLELQGFKSFADKTVLEFKPGITGVIGPNGSGKSNISDGIKWILGEQSMKSLRGTKSYDVIFAGTQNRKSLGFAEGSLVFDNSDGSLPIEYTEVTITRKLYRTGETGYYINKVPCRLKDILELFMDTGVGKDGYSIIGQGKIDEILSNKSEDRRNIFEEAAGIVKYRTRKEEAEKKLERTKLNLLRINDILSELETNIEPLKISSEKAKKYLNLHEELKNIEIGLFIYNIQKYKNSLDEIAKNEDIFVNQCNEEEQSLDRAKSLKDELKANIDDITAQIEEMSNLGFESQKEIEMLNSDINVARTKITSNEENIERYKLEIEETIKKLDDLQKEIEEKKEKKDNLKKNKEKYEKELKEKEEELKKITEKLSSKELEIEGYKKKVEENTDKKYDLQSQIKVQNTNIENYEKREKQIKNEITLNVSELDNIRFKKEEISKSFYEIQEKRNNLLKDIETANKKKESINSKIKDYETQIQAFQNEMRIKESRLKFLQETEKEREGYVKSVKSLLLACDKNKELGKGMYGVVANLIQVPEKYKTAIEMCLGFSLQNIVTQTEDDAKRLVEYLRKNNLGRASFLPISSVHGKKIEKINGKFDGIIGIASDLIKYEKKYEQIMINLLGRTIIVDNMETAIKVAKQNEYSFRIITLEGDIINPSGAITGGSVSKKTVNILGRKGEIEKLKEDIQKLNKKIEKFENEKQEYENTENNSLEEIELQEKEIQEIEIKYATEKQKLETIEADITKAQNVIEKLNKEQKNIVEEKEKLAKDNEEANSNISKLSEETEKLSVLIQEFSNINKDNQKYVDDLNFDITNLKISVSSFDESEMSIKELQERILVDIENTKKSKENKENQINIIKQNNTELEANIKDIKAKIEEVKESVKNSGTKIDELKQERVTKNNKLVEQEEKINEKFRVIEDLKSKIAKLDVQKSKTEEDINSIINKMWEEYELTPNNAGEYKKVENLQLTQKRVNELRKDIKDLGSVNIDSIDEYKKLKERYDFMCEQRVDLEDTMSKLRKIITNMTQTMKEQFKTKFELINKNFEETFKELFGGGHAKLKLEDENNILECGIDINVQPPGKKLQNMMLLSGGERAFTAIALLFAILKINPTPFCVLDEIEAALDDVNVYRFAEYLKKFSANTQFLVITHRKGTMEAADTVYGVTMEENGVSKLLSLNLKNA